MKRLATAIATLALTLTACGQDDSAFTDDQLDNARQVTDQFDTTMSVEETRYHEDALPLMEANGNVLTLDESLAACEDMRVSTESAYLINAADPADPEGYLAAAGILYDNMCELG